MGITYGPLPPLYVTDGLTFNIDCLNTDSYPGSGTVWTSTVNSANVGTMDGVTFDGEHMVFADAAGIQDNISFTQASNILTQTPMSLEWWFYPTNVAGNDILFATHNQPSSGTYDGIYTRTSNGQRLHLYGNDADSGGGSGRYLWTYYTTGGGMFQDDNWYHVVIVIGSTATVDCNWYLNGSLFTGGNPGGQPWYLPANYYSNGGYASATTDPLILGSEPGGNHGWDGYLDIARIYNRALTPAEVLTNFNAEKDRFGL